jgi:hypothetical protein
VGEELLVVDRAAFVVDISDETILVALDVENGEVAHGFSIPVDFPHLF